MREITPITVQIKRAEPAADECVLVHDGRQVLALAPEGVKASVPVTATVLVGKRSELEAEIAKRKLKPQTGAFALARATGGKAGAS